MTAERWAQIEELFQRAVDCATAERSRLLDEAASSDPELRWEVDSLLFCQPSAGKRLRSAIHSAVTPGRAEFQGTGRFVVQRRLGEGGFGIVYQVYDRQQDAAVALKVLPEAEAGALYQFKREFRGLANIVHRNLVMLYELLSDNQQWFFTMELVDGVDFVRYVRTNDSQEPMPPQSGLRFEQDRLRHALQQLAEGVGTLHQAGRLHCDLKPSNVLVTKDGRVVILDFGLATEIAVNMPDDTGAIIGTPAYMSPEQSAGGPLSEASDWYSVGTMLYQSLTGRLPIIAPTREMLAQKQDSDILSPCALTTGIPEDLALLCCDLLRSDPRDRPSGREVLERLGVPETGAAENVSGPSRMRSEMPFVGREKELAELRRAFAIVREGRAAIAYVHGGSGTGKSALVERFLKGVRKSDAAVVLAGRCYERESVPYKALDSLVDALTQYLKGLPRSQREPLVPRDVAALIRLFPVFERVECFARPDLRGSAIPDPHELRKHAFTAFRELLSRLARWKHLVLFIDDLQWGDSDSAVLLQDLFRPPDPPPILWIACYRSEEAETSPLLRRLLQTDSAQASAARLIELALKELDFHEARDLADRLLEEKQGAAASAETIARETGGSPFFIHELVRSMDENTGAPTSSLDELILARVSRLPETARLFLELVAIAGQPVTLEVVKRAAKVHREEESVVGLLRAAFLVRTRSREDGNEIEIYHDRTREAVGASVPPERLKGHHADLASELEASGRADPEILVTHFQGAGERRKATQYAVAAGDRASAALAFERAARLYRTALDLSSEDSEQVPRLHEKLGDALTNAGRGGAAAGAYLDAAAAVSGVEKLELQRRAAAQFLFSGRIEEGLAVTRGVLAAVGLNLSKTMHRSFLRFLFWRARIRLRGLRFHERDSTRIPAEERIRIDTCCSACQALSMVDSFWALEFHVRNLLYSLRAGDLYRIARALVVEATMYGMRGGRNRRRTQKALATATMLAERSANPHAMALAALESGRCAFLRGEWRECDRLMNDAETTLRKYCTGVAWELATARFFGLRSMFQLGELKLFCERLPVLLEEAEARDDLYQGTDLRCALSHLLHLAADQPEKAYEELDTALAPGPRQHHLNQHWRFLLARLEIDFYCGRGRAAWQEVTREWGPLRRTRLMYMQQVKILLAHHHGGAALVFAEDRDIQIGESKKLLRTAERDAAIIEREKTPWGTGLAFLVRAGVAARRGNAQQAARLLEAAEKTLESADMRLYAAAARRRRGELTAGDAGQALIAEADAWMLRQEIRNPARMAAMLAPGVSLPVSG